MEKINDSKPVTSQRKKNQIQERMEEVKKKNKKCNDLRCLMLERKDGVN